MAAIIVTKDHPCPKCGSLRLYFTQWTLKIQDGDESSTYHVICSDCGHTFSFEESQGEKRREREPMNDETILRDLRGLETHLGTNCPTCKIMVQNLIAEFEKRVGE